MKNKLFVFIMFALFLFPIVSSAHYITGNVNDAVDGFLANNREVVMFNYINGESDNLTDTIGPNGNSGQDNIYLFDCEELVSSCAVNDIITIKAVDENDGRVTESINVTVTGAGYDLAPNLTINSLPVIESILVDDSNNFTLNEIDLAANNTVVVSCESVVREYDSEVIVSSFAEFYSTVNSSYGDSDDNNFHYTNSSCFTNSSYGDSEQSKVTCTFDVLYYTQSGDWNCEMNVNDSVSIGSGVDSTTINPLLSIGIVNSLTFPVTGANEVSGESEIKVFNSGNIEVDLNLNGYGAIPGDDYAMSCDSSLNISVFFKKYRFSSLLGVLTLPQFEGNYTNLTGSPSFEDFNLASRQNDAIDDAFKSTFWRIYVPVGISGSCIGNIVFGAVVS